MLNDDDIKLRLERFPEPPEVSEIRNNIEKSFRNIEFLEGPHKYFIHEDDGSVEELNSVSSTVDKWIADVDWEAIKEKKAVRENVTVDYLTRLWKEKNLLATNSGTGAHLYGEMAMHWFLGHPERICDVIRPQYEEGWLLPHSPKEMAALKYYEDIHNIFMDDSKPVKIWPVMPESRIYIYKNNEWGITQRYSGTFDILHAYKASDGKWKLMVHDFKTNASLTSNFAREKKQFMKPPFDNFIDESLSHYAIQLSLYSIGLQQLGYEIVDRRLIWLKDDGTYEKVPVPDLREKCIKALQ